MSQSRLCRPWVGMFAFIMVAAVSVSSAEWSPPNQPKPDEILTEAENDATAGRYADALAKHVWFHQNALKYAPAMYGVRLSFALSSWVSLGECYPQALEKLRAIRDQAGDRVRRGGTDREAFHTFHEFSAINREVREGERTRELFIWLDANQPDLARQVFEVAEPDLVRSKEYQLCGKYLDPDRTLERAERAFRENMRLAKDPQFTDGEMEDFAHNRFSNSVATLVALLTVNGRSDDAARISKQATQEWDDPVFREQLRNALAGHVPEPWP